MDINMTERRKKAGRIQMNIIYGKGGKEREMMGWKRAKERRQQGRKK